MYIYTHVTAGIAIWNCVVSYIFYRKNKQGIVGLPQLSSTAYGYFIFMKLRKQVPFMDLRMELGQEGKKKMLKVTGRS